MDDKERRQHIKELRRMKKNALVDRVLELEAQLDSQQRSLVLAGGNVYMLPHNEPEIRQWAEHYMMDVNRDAAMLVNHIRDIETRRDERYHRLDKMITILCMIAQNLDAFSSVKGIEPALRGYKKTFMAIYTEYRDELILSNYPPDDLEILEIEINRWYEALERAVLKGQLDHMLTVAADYTPALLEQSYIHIKEALEPKGRPSGMAEWREWLAVRLNRLIAEHPGYEKRLATYVRRIMQELSDMPYRDANQEKALEQMKKWQKNKYHDNAYKVLYDYKNNQK